MDGAIQRQIDEDFARPALQFADREAHLVASTAIDRVRTAVDTLAAVGLAAAAVSRLGLIVYANPQFGSFVLRSDRIALPDIAAENAVLDGLAAFELSAVQTTVAVRAPNSGRVLANLQVIPISRVSLDVFHDAVAIIVATRPAGAPTDTDGSPLFDLTRAEMEVATGIASGLTPKQIARARGRSIATIRVQLQNAMQKTGSRRQLDLVLLLRSSAGPPSAV